ncbi:MAG: hypothetical protein IKY66_12030 [Bacteroidales bacterium]|nr:hypothetical protein [Bacteroidales bacterium]
MRSRNILTAVLLVMMTAVASYAQTSEAKTISLGDEIIPNDTTKVRRFKNRLIIPKGEWQCGLAVMYADFSSDDSDYMLILQGLNAKASLFKAAPEAAYSFADNHAVGVRFQYVNVNGMVDTATADLLGNLDMSVENLNAMSRSLSASVFQRTYVGLDNQGRVGIFWDYILAMSRTQSQFYAGESSSAYSIKKKLNLAFAPGFVYFPMNNVSVQASISLAELSYSNMTAYDDGSVVGVRNAWKAQANLNLLGISMGITVHF